MSQKPPLSQIFIVTTPLAPHVPDMAALAALFACVPIACLLLRFASRETRFAEPIVALAQQHGIAVLVEDDTRLMGQLHADGVHLDGARPDALETLQSLRQNRGLNIGVGNCLSRHDLMEFAEAGADYVFFGALRGQDVRQDAEPTHELLSWWATIFTTPCVALAENLAAVQAYHNLCADFVALEISLDAPHNNAMIALQTAYSYLSNA